MAIQRFKPIVADHDSQPPTTPLHPARVRRPRQFALAGLVVLLAAETAGLSLIGSAVFGLTVAHHGPPGSTSSIGSGQPTVASTDDVSRIAVHPARRRLRVAGPSSERTQLGGQAVATARPRVTADQAFDFALASLPADPGSGSIDAGVDQSAGTDSSAPVAFPSLRLPALGIDHSVSTFPCDRATPPGNDIYQWGCAGANNLYLLGHAWSVFKPLHDAYAAGRLAVGMVAYWLDAAGRSQTYHVTEWRLVRPTDTAWAIAAQPGPSMTLQTCYGAQSEWRLLVRLVA